MKEATKMSRAVSQLEHIYNKLNTDFFNAELPVPIITVQSKPATYGHFSTAKVWRRKNDGAYELNISAETVGGVIEEVLDTMIYEMVHLYCRENMIQDTSRGGVYHNKRFKAEAEKRELICYRTEKHGWNTTAANNDFLVEYALESGWSEIRIERNAFPRFTQSGNHDNTQVPPLTNGPRPSSTRKYICQKCRQSIRATKAVNILCGDCMERMIEI